MIELRILIASTRPGRFGPTVADWVRNEVPTDRFAVEVIDLAEVGLPFLDEPEMASTGIYVHEHTRRWKALVDAAEAIVIVTPEYNNGYPAALKNAIDFLYAEWEGKPIALVGYGFRAGASSREQLTTVLRRVKVTVVGSLGLRFSDHVSDGAIRPDDAVRRELAAAFSALSDAVHDAGD
ncbi:MAG TPA: NAD(P)H-dependent oxidoreductase [Dermatophilaceae bacterium]|nr:NAD(P)H-dependent oxidoreductase [Dermatophilaceae bacterium]